MATGKLYLRFKLQDHQVRITLVEFGRCFAAKSIAGGILRSNDSTPDIARLSRSMKIFANCAHIDAANSSENPTGNPCDRCSMQLIITSKKCEQYVSPAARFARSLADAAI